MRARSWFLLPLVLLSSACTSSSLPQPIWIGQVTALTGKQRERGQEAIRGIELVLGKAEADEMRIDGRAVGVRHADSAGPSGSGEVVRLLTVNHVAALLLGPGLDDLP